MIRAVFFTLFCVALVPSALAAAQDRDLLVAQVPPGFPGPPGPPGPGGPGWPGPAPGPEGLAHEQQCESMQRHLGRIQWRMRHSPPPVREQLAAEAEMTESQLRDQCWGQ